jgi:signal transduction histidine kinase
LALSAGRATIPLMARAAIAVGVAASGIAVGIASLWFARRGPDYSFAGTSVAGRAGLAAVGWALIAAGLAWVVAGRGARVGAVLAAAGFAWLLLEWNNPAVGWASAFTIGLVLYACCPALVAWAVLAFPGGRLGSWVERAGLLGAFVATTLLLGLLPALFFDPGSGCGACPRNLLLISGRPDWYADLNTGGLWLATVSASALAVLVAWKLARLSVAARRSGWVVLGAGAVYLALTAAVYAASLEHGFLWPGSLERRLWRGEAVTLLAVVLGLGWSWSKAERRRAALARLVLELAQSPPPGGLRDALAGIVGDETLELAYPVGESDRLVNVEGREVELGHGKEQTRLVGEGRTLAVLAHEPGLLDDQQLVVAVTAAARLALENERLQAEVRARVRELRRSRARIVEAGDAERRRLERDLHDGAQQRLAGLALSLRLLRSRLPAGADPVVAAELEAAQEDLQEAIERLRELAHGIFPAVLADGGLSAAFTALAEDSIAPIRFDGISTGRYAPEIETAAYIVVAEAATAARGGLVVHAGQAGSTLVLEVEARELGERFELAELLDRVEAAAGHLAVERCNGATTIRAEFPCGS